MSRRRTIVIIAGAAIALAAVAALAILATPRASAGSGPAPSEPVPQLHVSEQSDADMRGYWTPERIADAKPADMNREGTPPR